MKDQTIQNSFQHAGFVSAELQINEVIDDKAAVLPLCQSIRSTIDNFFLKIYINLLLLATKLKLQNIYQLDLHYLQIIHDLQKIDKQVAMMNLKQSKYRLESNKFVITFE